MRGALVFFLVATPWTATAAPATAKAPVARVATTHPEGQYGGVTPGEPSKDAKADAKIDAKIDAKAKRAPARGTLTWIGFEAKDGGAEVFFQSVAPFTVSQRVEGGSLIVHLDLPRLGHNTWRQIDTRFFDNPLAGIVARAVGATRASKARPARAAGVEAKIAFKNAKDAREATVRTATEADGMYYAYLAFGEGTASELPGDTSPDEPVTAPAASKPGKSARPASRPAVSKPVVEAPAAEAPAEDPPATPKRPQRQETDNDLPPDMPKK